MIDSCLTTQPSFLIMYQPGSLLWISLSINEKVRRVTHLWMCKGKGERAKAKPFLCGDQRGLR